MSDPDDTHPLLREIPLRQYFETRSLIRAFGFGLIFTVWGLKDLIRPSNVIDESLKVPLLIVGPVLIFAGFVGLIVRRPDLWG